MIKGPCDFMDGSSSFYLPKLPSLLAISILVLRMFLIYHVASRDHVFKGLRDLGGSFS